MNTELMDLLIDCFYVNLEAKDGDVVYIKIEGKNYPVIKEDGHRQQGKKVLDTLDAYFKERHSIDVGKLESHFKKPFREILKLVPPVFPYMMAAGELSPERFIKTLFDAPADAEVIANFKNDEEFIASLFKSYEVWTKAYGTPRWVTTHSDETGFKFILPKPEPKKMVDALLKSQELPTLDEIASEMGRLKGLSGQAEKFKTDAETLAKTLDKETKKWAKKVAQLSSELTMRGTAAVEVTGTGEIPSGKVVYKSSKDLFGIGIDFQVPCWEWDGPHPDVPAVDSDYIFREDLLTRALYAIISNQRMYLQGDTGSGKTTLIEQIAAHLQWPFGRINFDSEITRMDLIGRDTLHDGKTAFIDGFLPKYLSGPYIICFDEIDFVRPDVAYAMQAALEGNGIVITEDGGRRVKPHPMCRMFGTGNTVGQGDEKGMYQGARPQSIAFLDRFTVWAKVPYLDNSQRKDLLSKRVPALTDDEVDVIIKYSDEHLTAFDQAKVLQPISPRGIIAVGQTLAFLNTVSPKNKNNLHNALCTVVLDRATQGDFATLKGIVDRVCK